MNTQSQLEWRLKETNIGYITSTRINIFIRDSESNYILNAHKINETKEASNKILWKLTAMDHTPKCKTWTIKLLEDNIGKNLEDLGYGHDILDITTKARSMGEIMDKLDSIRIFKKSALQKTLSREKKTSHRLGENVCKRRIW